MTAKKTIIITTVTVLVAAIALEAIALLHEKASIDSFAAYWKRHNAAAQGTLTYVALGDSTAQGIGARDPRQSYAGILAKRLAEQHGQTIRFINLSKSGAKIKDALDTQVPQLAALKPDIVTIEIGANDLSTYNPATFEQQFSDLCDQLPPGTYVSNMPYFGGRIRKNDTALAANVIIQRLVAAHHLQLVDLQSLTRERQSIRNYAADLFHPSSRGYTNWADAFWLAMKNDPRH